MIALWSLCLLASFAVILGYGVRQKLILVQRLDERDKLHFIAEAGVKKAIAEIKNTNGASQTNSALKDEWSNNIEAFSDIAVGNGKFNVCYNYIDDVSGAQTVWWGMVDEERKININKINIENMSVLKTLFRLVLNFDDTQAQELAASIIDWRDDDNLLSIEAGSAEDRYYMDLEYPYKAKNADFQVLEELLLVKGMTQDSFEKLKNYITVYGGGEININTASKIVLLSLGLNEPIVDNILAFRAGDDKIVGTSDDYVFNSSSEVVEKLNPVCNLTELDKGLLNALAVKSSNFLIRSVANLNNRQNTGETVCIVSWKGKILYWQES
jgi:general secretion pathway protein K